jgi:rhamnosyltransferase
MNASPRVLVLLAAHNGAQWIGVQVRSILAQDDVSIRLCVRDDASTDGTKLELAEFAADERLHLESGMSPTGSAAQNFLHLIRANASGACDFVALADQDDIWSPDKIAKACRTLRASGGAGYSSATLAFWRNGRQRLIELAAAQGPADFLFEGAGQGCTFVMSRGFYERARRFVVEHTELTRRVEFHDWMLYALARAWGLKWVFDPVPSIKYRQHDGNEIGARGMPAGAAKRLQRIRNGWYRGQLEVICEICTVAAPESGIIASWRELLQRPRGWRRNVQLAPFCLRMGRRRLRDNLVLALASLAGWI